MIDRDDFLDQAMRRPAWVLVLVAALIFAGVLWVLSLIAMLGLLPGPQAVWDAASEANVWTWGNAVLFVSAAYAGLTCAVSPNTAMQVRLAWLAFCAAVLLLSLDDVASFHERLEPVGRRMGGGDGAFHFAWVVPGLLFGLIALLGFGVCAKMVGGRAGQLVLIGAVVFFLGALGLEIASGAYLSAGGSNLVYALLYHVEEAVEAIGAALLLAAGHAPTRAATLGSGSVRP